MKIELSHDILAKRIYDKASSDDKMLLKVREFLADRLAYYEESNILLSKADLRYISPFLDELELSTEETNLIDKSDSRLKRIKGVIYLIILIVIFLLLGFNYLTRSYNADSKNFITKRIEIVSQYALIDKERSEAEAEAEKLYNELKSTTPEFEKELLNSYDTLQQNEEVLIEELNIAQSSTLSKLAQTALAQDDINYAFKLAAKSWELNPSNKHACDILYTVNDYYYEHDHSKVDNDSSHHAAIKKLIAYERTIKKRGELIGTEMATIFNSHNSVLNKKNDGIKDKIKTLYKQVTTTTKEAYEQVEDKIRN
jgi:hypothetical protein